MARGRGDGLTPEDLSSSQQDSLIKQYTLTLQNGDKLVPSWQDVLKILNDNYKISQSHKMSFKDTEVPYTEKGYRNVLRGYDPNKSFYEGNAESIEDDTASRRSAYTKSQSAQSLSGAMKWAEKLSKKYPKRKNPSGKMSFHNSESDLDWLFSTHLKNRGRRSINSFMLYGNEDSPDKVDLYKSKHPKSGEKCLTVEF